MKGITVLGILEDIERDLLNGMLTTIDEVTITKYFFDHKHRDEKINREEMAEVLCIAKDYLLISEYQSVIKRIKKEIREGRISESEAKEEIEPIEEEVNKLQCQIKEQKYEYAKEEK